MQQNVTKCNKIFEKINFLDTVQVKGPYKIFKKIEKTNFLETVFFLSGENFHAHSAAQCASFEHNTSTNVSTVFEKMKFSCHKISPPLVVLSDHTFLRSLFWYNPPLGERELGYVSRPLRVSGEDFNYSFFRTYTVPCCSHFIHSSLHLVQRVGIND